MEVARGIVGPRIARQAADGLMTRRRHAGVGVVGEGVPIPRAALWLGRVVLATLEASGGGDSCRVMAVRKRDSNVLLSSAEPLTLVSIEARSGQVGRGRVRFTHLKHSVLSFTMHVPSVVQKLVVSPCAV